MPEVLAHKPSAAEISLDRQLIGSLLLSPFAVLTNTVVGYTVSHWVCDVNRKATDYVVCFCDFALCLLAAFLAFSVLRKLPQSDDTQPETGRRIFMAKLCLVLAALATLIVIAQTLVPLTLQPCD